MTSVEQAEPDEVLVREKRREGGVAKKRFKRSVNSHDCSGRKEMGCRGNGGSEGRYSAQWERGMGRQVVVRREELMAG